MVALENRHTGEYLSEKTKQVLQKYSIKLDQIFTGTSDNGKNMTKTLEILNDDIIDAEQELADEEESEDTNFDGIVEDCMQNLMDEISLCDLKCCAHTLQLAINDLLKDYKLSLGHIRTFVKDLRTPNNQLKLRQKKVPTPPRCCNQMGFDLPDAQACCR